MCQSDYPLIEVKPSPRAISEERNSIAADSLRAMASCSSRHKPFTNQESPNKSISIMSQSGILSQVIRAIEKKSTNQERSDDRKEPVYIHISSAKGYKNLTRILDGENVRNRSTANSRHAEPPQTDGTQTSQGVTIGTTPTEGTTSKNDESSGRLHRSSRTSGNNESQSGTGGGGAQEAQ